MHLYSLSRPNRAKRTLCWDHSSFPRRSSLRRRPASAWTPVLTGRLPTLRFPTSGSGRPSLNQSSPNSERLCSSRSSPAVRQASVTNGQRGKAVQRAPSQAQPLPEQPPWVRQTFNRTCRQQTSTLSAVVFCRPQQSLHVSW